MNWKKIVKKLFVTSDDKRVEKTKETVDPKAQATARGEPYIAVIKTHFDPENPRQGYFELDWNDLFVNALIKDGYGGETNEDIVNSWFEDLCKNVVYTNWEEILQSNGTAFIQRRDRPDGKREYS